MRSRMARHDLRLLLVLFVIACGPAAIPSETLSAPAPTSTVAPTPVPLAQASGPGEPRTPSAPTATATPRQAPPSPAPATRAPSLDCTPHSFPQRTQGSFAVDPTDDRKLYIGVEQEGFFKSIDGGTSWQRASAGIRAWDRLDGTGLCHEEFYATVIDPADPARICTAKAGGPGTLGARTSAVNNGVYCSSDAAATWKQVVGPTMNTAVYALAADPRDFNVLYAGVNGGPCSNPPPICQPGTYFNTTGAIYKTTDGGGTWTELNALYVPDLRVVALHVDQRDPQVILAATFSKLPTATAGPGSFGAVTQLGLLRSADGGRTWTSSLAGMSADPREQALLAMAAAPRNAANVYVTASSNTSYWSADGGRTFNKAVRMATFAFDPHDPAGLRMLGSTGEEIRESADGGRTWTARSKTPGFVAFDKGVPTKIEWSRTTPSTVFLAGPYATVFRSTDRGATWTQILSADRLPRG